LKPERRVAINVSPLGWRPRSGISTYVRSLLTEHLRVPERAARVACFLYARRGSAVGEAEALLGRDVRVWRLPERAAFRLFRLPALRSWGMDGIDAYHETSIYLRALPRRCRAVYTVYDVLPLLKPEWYSSFSAGEYSRAFHPSVKRADRIIVQSRAARSDLLEIDPSLEGKLAVVPNGVDTDIFRPADPGAGPEEAPAKLGIPRPYILFTGAVQPRKNVDRLARAFARIAADAPHALVLAGPVGWRGKEILARIRSGPAGDRVRHLGFVPDGLLPGLYRAADLYAFPSRAEGFGLTVLEAMASGVPVVTSSVSALPEVAGDASLIVHPDDEEGLAAAMRRVLEDAGVRRELAAKGLARAREFSWARTAAETWALCSDGSNERG
jgi:glycosyltransferase involved in cell wall biosynthesis